MRRLSLSTALAAAILASAVSSGALAATLNAGGFWRAPPALAVSGWQYVDGGGFSATGNSSLVSHSVAFNGKVYLASGEEYSIYIYSYNGNDSAPVWTNIAGADGINHNTANVAVQPRLAVLNAKLYATWLEANGSSVYQVRVSVYNGNDASPSWTSVDGGGANGLNFNTAKNATDWPTLAVLNSKFYLSWPEVDASGVDQLHVRVYNGNDVSPSWAAVDGGGSNGINYSTAEDASAPAVAVLRNKMYLSWSENSLTMAFVYNGNDGSPSWASVAGAGLASDDPNSDNFGVESLAISNGKLYMSGSDSNSQIRPVVYNGNDASPAWSFVDGGVAQGINYDSENWLAGPSDCSAQLIPFGNQLYMTWYEQASFSQLQTWAEIPWAGIVGWAPPATPYNVRLSVYNGNDASAAWALKDGNSGAGINSDPTQDVNGDQNDGNTVCGQQATGVALGNKLYVFWIEFPSYGGSGIIRAASILQNTHASTLSFALSAQTLQQYQCQLTAVRAVDGSGNPALAASAQTISLSGSGAGFYADAECSHPIFSVNLASGADATAFYLMYSTSPASAQITASSALGSAQQAETLSSDAFVWTGAHGDGLWATATNWSGNHAPGAADVAIFDGTCTNCTVSIASTINVGGVHLESTFSGAITQNAAITVGYGGWIQEAGSFTGGSSTITVNGEFKLAGGTFASTTGTLYVVAPGAGTNTGDFVLSGGTFTPGTGTVSFGKSLSGSEMIIASGSTVLNNVAFSIGSSAGIYGTLSVAGNLAMAADNEIAGTGINFSGSALTVTGGIVTAPINFTGSGTQTISSSVTLDCPLTVSGGGTLQFASAIGFFYAAFQPITVTSGTLDLNGHGLSDASLSVSAAGVLRLKGTETLSISAATFDPASSVNYYGTSNTAIPSIASYPNLTFSGTAVFKAPSGGFTVGGTLLISAGTFNDNGQSIVLNGAFTNNAAFTSTGTETFSGSGSFAIGGSGAISFNNLILAASGSNWTLGEAITAKASLSITAGTLNASGNGITINGSWSNSDTFTAGGNTVTLSNANHIIDGNTTFSGLSMTGITAARIVTFQASSTTTVTGTLTLAGTSGTKTLTLQSDNAGTQWTLVPPASTTLGGDLVVTDSNSTAAVHGGTGSICNTDDSGWTCP